jgi:hypothetical protein
MRTTLLPALLAAAWVALRPAAAPAQYAYYAASWPFGPAAAAGEDLPGSGTVYARAARVYGPGTYYAYPPVYRSNSPGSFAAFHQPTPASASTRRRLRHGP